MCGRFAQITSIESIKKLFKAKGENIKIAKNYNLSPSQKAIIVYKNNNIEINTMNWGITPKWNNSLNIINIRVESIKSKKYFNGLFMKNRCIIPADGFFEWHKENNKKQAYFIKPEEEAFFLLAGLYDNEKSNYEFAIITKPSESIISEIHHRMPAILSLSDALKWISDDFIQDDLLNILIKPTESEIRFFKVSNLVNNVRNNSEELILPV